MPTNDDMNEIVIVDDSPSNLTILQRILSEAGFKACAFKNNAHALHSIFAKPPALVLLDAKTPDMGEVCRRLNADERTCDIPVIFITATDGKIIYTNPADAQMHGYAVNELIRYRGWHCAR